MLLLCVELKEGKADYVAFRWCAPVFILVCRSFGRLNDVTNYAKSHNSSLCRTHNYNNNNTHLYIEYFLPQITYLQVNTLTCKLGNITTTRHWITVICGCTHVTPPLPPPASTQHLTIWMTVIKPTFKQIHSLLRSVLP